MINTKYKAIFLHIPKTGGTSIKKNIDGFRWMGEHRNWFDEKKMAGALWDIYFKFTIVRNPWDRVYSIFSYYKMGKNISGVDPKQLPKTFENFVLDDKHLIKLGFVYNQCEYIGDEMDYIAKFENYSEEFEYIRNKLNAPKQALTNERKSIRNPNYRDVYTDKMVTIIRNKFIKDIEKFNYEF